MPSRSLLLILGGSGSGAVLHRAVEQVTTKGPDLTGIAAIIAASAGMISAIGALLIGLRSNRSDSDKKEELLMDMWEELQARDKADREERERKGRRR